MTSENAQGGGALSGLLTQLTDRDVVIEIAGSAAAPRAPDVAGARLIQDAVDASYRALAGAVRAQLQTVAIVEEVARRGLSLWLRVEVNDGSSESEESLLKFLARGTLAIVAWMDGSPTLQLADLQQAIRVLAWGTSITTTAHPVLPTSAELVEAIIAWQKAKGGQNAGDGVRIITNNGSADLDLSKRIDEPRSLLLSRKLVNHSADMIFLVEMPDYQSSGQWQLKHGDVRTVAVAEPGTLLDKFYRRELDIRPGDALRCRVDLETSYGPDHEVLSEQYRIVEILEVLNAAKASTESPAEQPAPAAVAKTTQELEDATT
jgi:hypothetical protein